MPAEPAPRNLIIGTAGHIDHGKTVLVKALTGKDTDRLAEEKQRGISIDLGFAPLTLSDGSVVGIVDVPGHENFIRNMMSGATGVDLALLVIAADDGVMPQTREHLAILDLLGVSRAVVAITKTDVVEPDLIPLVEDEIIDLLEGTPLEGSPVVAVSAATGIGLDELRLAIDAQAASVRLKDEALPPRMPIDRVFTLKGIGTVVTGTLWTGALSPGMKLEILPGREEVRVRSLEVHDVERERANAGERVAVSLAGTPRERVSRGDVLAEPGCLSPTYMLDARVRLLKSRAKPVMRGARIRFHHGTREVLARIYPLRGDRLNPGDSLPAQLRLEDRAVVAPADRFVIRSYSPVTTIGGGTVIDPHPGKHRLEDAAALAQFEALESGDAGRKVGVYLDRASVPLSSRGIALSSGLPRALIEEGLEKLGSGNELRTLGDVQPALYLSREHYERLEVTVRQALEEFHASKPLAEGIARETLKKQVVPEWDPRSADLLIEALASAGAVRSEGKLIRLPGRKAAVTRTQKSELDEIVARIEGSPVSPPTVGEIAGELGTPRKSVAELLGVGEREGRLIRVSPDLYFSKAAMADIERKLRENAGPEGITVSEFRVAVGTSRKYALPLLEYFDRNRVTVRHGDVRKLK